MGKWRDQSLDDMFELMIKENDEALGDTQVRGWAAVAEMYLEEYHNLLDLETKLGEVWTSDAGDAFLVVLKKVREQVYNAWSNAYDNAHALDQIASHIGSTQYLLQQEIFDFEEKLDAKWEQFHKDMDTYKDKSSDLIMDGSLLDKITGERKKPKEPDREALMDDSSMGRDGKSPNQLGGDLMESTMNSVHQIWLKDFWIPDAYDGPIRSQQPTGMPPGMGGPGMTKPSMTGSPPPPAPPPVAPPPMTPPVAPPVNPPTQNKPTVTPPNVGRPPGPAVGTPNRPGTPPVPPSVGAPGGPGVNRPGVSPATGRPIGVRPTAPAAPAVGGVPGKPPAGQMAPPPAAMAPKGGAKGMKPGKGGRPGAPGTPGVPGKPGAGRMAPPPMTGMSPKSGSKTGKNPGTPGRPGTHGGNQPGVPGGMGPAGKPGAAAPGKPGASRNNKSGTGRLGSPSGGGAPFAPTPHIGGKRQEKPNRPDRRGFGGKGITPPGGLPGRVTRQGGTRPVLSGGGITPPPLQRGGFGVPPSLAPRGKNARVSGEAPGVIRPAEEKPVSVPRKRITRDEAKLRELMKNPLTAELINSKSKLLGRPTPVIDAPEPEQQQNMGPVLGYRAKA